MEAINGISIPDFEDPKGNYMKGNSFYIKESKKHVEFLTDERKNAFILANKKVSAQFKAKKFRYHAAPLVTAKGHVEVDLNEVDIEIGLSFDTQHTNDGHIVPYVTAVDVKCDINRHDIKIHLHGNLITDIGAMFEIFFKGPVSDAIEDTIRLTLNQGVPAAVNLVMKHNDGEWHIPNVINWILDWQTQNPIQVKSDWIGAGIRGLFYDEKIGREEPEDQIPEMPYKSADHSEKFQIWASSYSINSLFGTITEVFDMDFMVYAEDMNGLTAGMLAPLLPGMAQTYGADALVDLEIIVHRAYDFHSYAGNQEMTAIGDLDLKFWCHTADGKVEYAVGLALTGVNLGMSALTENMSVTLQIVETINIGHVAVLYTSIGKISAA